MRSRRDQWPPRRVLVVPDKFKGTLTSAQAGRAIVTGLQRAWPQARFTRLELSDGGDGFARLLVKAAGGVLHRARTFDATGRPRNAVWGMLPGDTAVLDLASASGLAQLPPSLRNPAHTSTYGTGLLLRRALANGARTIIVGLGGSATNDGGIGIAAAMGYRFLDARGYQIELTGTGLLRLAAIELPPARPRIHIVAATDVDNPLLGPRGAVRQFARQKGASAAMLDRLETGLRVLGKIVCRDLRVDFVAAPGAGAGGGCGFGLMAFLGAQRIAGFEVVRSVLRLDEQFAKHDLVVTGEGCFDRTSLAGKAPLRVAQLAHELGTPAWGLFGSVKLRPARRYFTRIATVDAAVERNVSAAVHARRLADAATRMAQASSLQHESR